MTLREPLTATTGITYDPITNTLFLSNVGIGPIRSNMLYQVSMDGSVKFWGTGSTGTKSGSATTAQFSWPTNLATDSSGGIYLADRDNNLIRKIANGMP